MVQASENICYSPMSLERHDLREVAGLIYESAPELFALMFGSRAIARLEDLVRRSHNRFSHRYVRVAELTDRVVGIAILLHSERLNYNTDYHQMLDFSQQLRLKLVQRLILRHVLPHGFPSGTFYISNLAVAADYRRRGIGRQLLSRCIVEAAADSTPNTIFIGVDVNNPRAQKLYESVGFQVASTKAVRLGRMAIGSHLLSLSIPN